MSAEKKEKIIDFPTKAQSLEGVKKIEVIIKHGDWKLAYNKPKKAA